MDVLNASNPDSSSSLEITGPKQIIYPTFNDIYKYGFTYYMNIGLSDYSNLNSIEFSFICTPASEIDKLDFTLNALLEDYFKLNNPTGVITKKSDINDFSRIDYLVKTGFFINNPHIEGEIIINAKLNEEIDLPSFKINVTNEAVLGDVNEEEVGYHEINEKDVNAMRDYILGKNPESIKINRGDIDGNGRINVNDIIGLIDIINKK